MKTKYLIIFVTLLISGCSDQITKNSEILSLNLVAHYPFNGSSDDMSRNNAHGVVIGAKLIDDRNNNPNAAYFFDGANDRIVFPYSEATNFDASSESFTISLWVKGDSNNFPNCRIFQKWNDTLSTPYMISIQAEYNKCHAIIYDTEELDIVHFGKIWDNKWHNLVVKIDNTKKLFSIFLDGSLVDQTDITLEQTTKTEHVFSAGGSENSRSIRFMRGAIDDIRIYNKALSEDEIELLSGE